MSHTIMLRQLEKNQNSQIIKNAIREVAKGVQQRVYWLNTSEIEGDFLQQYWDKQVTANSVLKKRICQITQQKFDQLFAQVDQGKHTPSQQLEINIDNLNLSMLAQQIPIFNSSYFTQDHPKTKQTRAKIKQIQNDYQKFKEKVQEIKRKQLQKKRQKAQIQQQVRQSMQKQKKQRIKQHVMKTIQQKSRKQQQRKIQNEKFKQFLKVYKGSKPLHVLMQEQYKQKFQLPMIEQNRRKLQQYKQNKQKVKPSLEQINDHQRTYLQLKQQRQRESPVHVLNKTIDVTFKSKFYLAEEEKMNSANQGYQTIFDQVQKKKRYSELVKQNFKPKISAKLRNSINQSQIKKSDVKQSLDRNALQQRGKLYLQFVKSLQKNRKQHSSPSERAQKQQQQSQRYVNYLQELKQSRQIQGNQSKLSTNWQRDIRNKSLSEVERRQRLLMKSKQLQEIAHRKQQFVNNYNYGKAEQIIQRKKQIDQTLISSIRAKVAILKQAHEV